jgi:hypothetical protein
MLRLRRGVAADRSSGEAERTVLQEGAAGAKDALKRHSLPGLYGAGPPLGRIFDEEG